MKRKVDLFEVLVIVGCLLFTIAISLYHLSFDGYLGLSATFWDAEWSIAENGLLLFLSYIVSLLLYGITRNIFRYVLGGYFILKLIYQFSCFSGIYFWSVQIWENIWSWVLVVQIILGISFCLIKVRKG